MPLGTPHSSSTTTSLDPHLQRAECAHLLVVQQRFVGRDVHDPPEPLKLAQVEALAAGGR